MLCRRRPKCTRYNPFSLLLFLCCCCCCCCCYCCCHCCRCCHCCCCCRCCCQGAYGPWKPWKVLEFRKPFSRSWKGLENWRNQEDPWKDLEFWCDKLDFRWKHDPRVEQTGSLSKIFGEELGSKHERGGRGRRDRREGRRDAWRWRVGVDPRLRTSIARRLNLHHGLASAIEGFKLTMKITRRAWNISAFCLGSSWGLNIDWLHESLTRRRFAHWSITATDARRRLSSKTSK